MQRPLVLQSLRVCVPVMQTGFSMNDSNDKNSYKLRRQALRDTWFPADAEQHRR
jgi:hypothetical protein